MMTYTQLQQRAYDFMGINSATDTTDVTNAAQDINNAQRLIEASARRYWTRGAFVTSLVAKQQYYTLPAEVVRITTVRANGGNDTYNWPIEECTSEMLWNRFNVIPTFTVIVPQIYFVRGSNEFGLYPTPGEAVTNGLLVSCELRAPDMSIADVTTTTVSVTNGNQYVTSPSTNFSTNMVGMVFSTTDGSDGKWYRVTAATATQLTLDNAYEGPTETGVACIIGQAPAFPEAYHMGCAYYAAYQYYLKRTDGNTAVALYKGLFEDVLTQYKNAYAAKTTGMVEKPLGDQMLNIFWLNPQGLTMGL
jgi:hypothetical protein